MVAAACFLIHCFVCSVIHLELRITAHARYTKRSGEPTELGTSSHFSRECR